MIPPVNTDNRNDGWRLNPPSRGKCTYRKPSDLLEPASSLEIGYYRSRLYLHVSKLFGVRFKEYVTVLSRGARVPQLEKVLPCIRISPLMPVMAYRSILAKLGPDVVT